MVRGDEITMALGAHGLWKDHLLRAIRSSKSAITVAQARRDDACDFGAWLLALPASDKKSAQWKKVHEIHALFHEEAAKVLDLALRGEKALAEESMCDESPFMTASRKLISGMMIWLVRSKR